MRAGQNSGISVEARRVRASFTVDANDPDTAASAAVSVFRRIWSGLDPIGIKVKVEKPPV